MYLVPIGLANRLSEIPCSNTQELNHEEPPNQQPKCLLYHNLWKTTRYIEIVVGGLRYTGTDTAVSPGPAVGNTYADNLAALGWVLL